MKSVLISGILILTAFCLQGQIVNSGFESGTITPSGNNYLPVCLKEKAYDTVQ